MCCHEWRKKVHNGFIGGVGGPMTTSQEVPPPAKASSATGGIPSHRQESLVRIHKQATSCTVTTHEMRFRYSLNNSSLFEQYSQQMSTFNVIDIDHISAARGKKTNLGRGRGHGNSEKKGERRTE
ncbi:hypothetical protein CDAR_40322 [Caerostris darwini]|uniref:Uncharacterized protein n=1 Tax=Caerostris darwini TaxID=1538125 RepID=A0AAV4RB15_9ARAC|nr:hypothetical protein CDAR_40322 [Caerostris darwini]